MKVRNSSIRKSLSSQDRYRILKRDEFKCQYCGQTAPDVQLHVDHLIPVALGGQNEELNLLAACGDCNMGKSADMLPEHILLAIQEEIKERIKNNGAALQYIKKGKKKKKRDSHLRERPIGLLKRFPIHEPFKGKYLNPGRNHKLIIQINEKHELSFGYGILNPSGWSHMLKSFNPNEWGDNLDMSQQQFNQLFEKGQLSQLEEYIDTYQKILVHEGSDGLHLITVIPIDRPKDCYCYAFWTPIDKFEIDIKLSTTEEYEYMVETFNI